MVAHKSNLAYKDVANSVSEVKLITADVVSVGSYFHVSEVQTHGLKEAAEASGLSEPLHWPDFKGVRLPNLLINFLQCSCATIEAAYAIRKKDMMQNQVDSFESGTARTEY